MCAATNLQWALITVLAAFHLLTCATVAMLARRAGLNAATWFAISLLLTALPAAFCLVRRRAKSTGLAGTKSGKAAAPPAGPKDATVKRCRHCGAIIPDRTPPGGPPLCPECRLVIEEDYLA